MLVLQRPRQLYKESDAYSYTGTHWYHNRSQAVGMPRGRYHRVGGVIRAFNQFNEGFSKSGEGGFQAGRNDCYAPVGVGRGFQAVSSRIMAQHRMTSRLATATMAFFRLTLLSLPPVSRSKSSLAHGLNRIACQVPLMRSLRKRWLPALVILPWRSLLPD